MKVAFVSQPFDLVLPPEQTSIGIWTHEVARRLASENEIRVYARRPRGIDPTAVPSFVHLVGCAPMRVWNKASQFWARVRGEGDPFFARQIYACDFLVRVIAGLRRFRPDVVHLQNFPQYAAAIRKALPESAIVLHMHCDWLAELDIAAMARSVAAVDVVAGCSSHVTGRAQTRFGRKDLPCFVLPNGTSVDAIARPRKVTTGRKVVFVGRVSPEKGVHTLLEAWPQVVGAYPDARLEIIGPAAATPREFLVDLSDDARVRDLARFYPGGQHFSGSYEAMLKALIPQDLRHTVVFAGHQPHARIAERLRDAALLVNPSLSESFGMSLIEAMAAGTPVVASRVGGMPEVVEATGGGVLVEPDEPAILARAINASLARPDLGDERGRQASRKVAELFSWPRIARRASELHEEAVHRRREQLRCAASRAAIS